MLTEFQRRLAEEYLKIGTKVGAYKAVRTDWRDAVGDANVHQYASRAFTDDVMAEYSRLKTLAADAERKAAEEDAAYCRQLWSKRKSVEQLVDIIRDCERTRMLAREAGEAVPSQVAMVEKNTVDTLNKMMGYNEPEKATVDNTINITFGNGEEGADWAV